MEDIALILQESGLSEKEVGIYLALIQLGEATASRASELAELNRVTTYALLKSMEEKGFCSVFDKNNVKYFRPVKPEQILNLLEEKKRKVKIIIPLLKKKQNQVEERPEINLFEGKKGIVSLLDIILRDAEKEKMVFSYGNLSIAEQLLEYQSLHWRKTRLAKKIKLRGIVDVIPDYISQDAKWKELTERRIFKNLDKLNAYTLVTSNFVAYFTLKGELVGILIKNKELAEKEKFNFELLWANSDKSKKQKGVK